MHLGFANNLIFFLLENAQLVSTGVSSKNRTYVIMFIWRFSVLLHSESLFPLSWPILSSFPTLCTGGVINWSSPSECHRGHCSLFFHQHLTWSPLFPQHHRYAPIWWQPLGGRRKLTQWLLTGGAKAPSCYNYFTWFLFGLTSVSLPMNFTIRCTS